MGSLLSFFYIFLSKDFISLSLLKLFFIFPYNILTFIQFKSWFLILIDNYFYCGFINWNFLGSSTSYKSPYFKGIDWRHSIYDDLQADLNDLGLKIGFKPIMDWVRDLNDL